MIKNAAYKNLAPQVGFEPTTYRLTADCSTVELLWNVRNTFILADDTTLVNGVEMSFLTEFFRPLSLAIAAALIFPAVQKYPRRSVLPDQPNICLLPKPDRSSDPDR